ncbi:cupin [Dyella jiangningensis]|uniref:cupin domain-containing protein n=1 Tax=Dyella sp. EPa41 TaxID=1561194 RepID=UPI0004564CF7|nr:cupin domain-containing protein [Dyella sp. EPa41]AHX13376.1 cupin [Dyella jiangningensis]
MSIKRLLAALLATAAFAGTAYAQAPEATVKPNFAQAIPNLPGKSLVAVEVSYPPGGASTPHHHARSAFIYAYVVSGEIQSQVDDGPMRTYRAGESFYEAPGAHHRVSGNASKTQPAKLLAVFVVDTGEQPLTTPDK